MRALSLVCFARIFQGQNNLGFEAGAVVLQADLPAVQVKDFLNKRQPQAAAFFTAIGPRQGEEFVKNLIEGEGRMNFFSGECEIGVK